jgi:hypothetical protein
MKSQVAFHADGQLLLFPRLLCWPDDAFSVIDQPAPGLASVLVAPVFDVNNGQKPRDELRCFAVSADRQFAALVTVAIDDLHNLDSNSVWQRVCDQVENERALIREILSDWSMQPPVDCLAGWCNSSAWLKLTTTDAIHPLARTMARRIGDGSRFNAQELIDAEADAQLHVERLIKNGVGQVVSAMNPEFAALFFARPNLPMSVVCGLAQLASQCGVAALQFAMQALKTEAISLLDLARSAPVDPVGRAVFETICNGFSLPRTLQAQGISKAAHRRTMHCVRHDLTVTNGTSEFSELPLSGRNWRITMGIAKQLPFELWPNEGTEWREFIAVTRMIHAFGLGRKLLVRLLRWCAAGHYADCSLRLTMLLKQAQALTTAADQLGGFELGIEAALSIALNMAPINARRSDPLKQVESALDTREVGRTLVELALFTGLDLEPWVAGLFSVHPDLPRTFQIDPHIDVQALKTFREVVDHGCDSGTCLQHGAIAIQYAACGVALYAARDAQGELLGTLGLRLKVDDSRPAVNVTQVTGMFNETAAPSLYRCATRLAKSYSADSLGDWRMFAAQIDKFRQAAGASL